MQMRKRLQVLALASGAAALAGGLASCRDALERAVAPQKPDLAVVVSTAIEPDSGWDTYSADVVVTTYGPDSLLLLEGEATDMKYHVDRTLDANQVWTTTSTFTAPDRFMADAPLSTLGRAVLVEDGVTAPRIYDAAGRLLTAEDLPAGTLVTRGDLTDEQVPPGAEDPIPQIAAPTSGASSGPAARTRRGTPQASGTSAAGGVTASAVAGSEREPRDPRAWLDDIVITPAARSRVLARLEKYHGKSVGKLGNLDRYVTRSADGRLLELLVDPAIGAVVEENYAERGRLESHTTHRFTPMSNGGYVRTVTRVEAVAPSRPGVTTVTETELRNISVRRSAGGAQ